MAKRKPKTQEPVETKGDAHEVPITAPAEPPVPQDGARTPAAADGQVSPAEKEPAQSPARQPVPRAEPKPRPVIGRYFKDRRVELIDDGNAGGVGIKLSYDDPAERPSDEVKQIVKEGDENRPGFAYQGGSKQWRKRIGADAAPRTAVAIRLDAERRFEAVGEQISHEERLKAERAGEGKKDEPTPS